MSPEAFAIFQGVLKVRAGLVIAAARRDLLEARLVPVVRRFGFATSDDLALALAQGSAPIAEAVVEAAIIRETMFFRDREPFDQLRTILAGIRERNTATRQIRIWSAACSTGQEAYSLAMLLDDEVRHFKGWSVEIVATDISSANLATAANGLYNQFEVQRGLPATMLLRYFKRDGDLWRIDAHLRHRISFERFNLLDDPARLGRFDLIFCRNVLIYFDLAARRRVLANLGSVLRRDGLLCLGAAETTIGVTSAFKPHPEHGAYLAAMDRMGGARSHLRLVG